LIKEPTRVPDRSGDNSYLLDLFLTSNQICYKTSVSAPVGTSDHCLISICLQSASLPTPSSYINSTHWYFEKADWDGFRDFIAAFPWNFYFSNDLSSTVENITEIIQTGMETYIPHSIFRKKMSSPGWFNSACARAVETKRRAYLSWKSDKTPQTHSYFQSVSKQTQLVIKLAKTNFLNRQTNKLINNPNDNRVFWSTVKNFESNFYRSSVPPLTAQHGEVVTSPLEKANLLAELFAANSTLPPLDNDLPASNMNAPPMSNIRVFPDIVQKILNGLDVNKASGPDEIPPIVLKKCAPELSPIFSRLFKLSLKLAIFPEPWKLANVHPIPKKGDHCNPANYRPISLTSSISKVFETLVNNQLTKHIESNILISDRQYGFRRTRSTTDVLACLLHRWNEALDRFGETQAVALDISKAFDRVSHPVLISKLSAFGLPPELIAWFSSFLSSRQIRVLLDGLHSEYLDINAGVPQGSVLASLAFLLHLNPIFTVTANPVHSYADDSTLHKTFHFKTHPSSSLLEAARSDTTASLNADLTELESWASDNIVSFNASKTQSIIISNRNTTPISNLTFNGIDIQNSTSIEILGITVDSKLCMDRHIINLAKKASSKLSFLYRAKPNFTAEQLVIIYKSHVRSQMEYGSPLFAGCSAYALHLLDSVQNKFIRLVDCPALTDCLSSLSLRRDVASLCLFYRYFHGHCSEELHSLIPPLRTFNRSTRFASASHDFVVEIPAARTEKYYNSFIPRTSRLWNSLPPHVFPTSYDMQTFKSNVFLFLSSL
jgi:hypothetical protein